MYGLEVNLIKRGLSLGLCALLATNVAFWATFVSSLVSLAIVQWLCVPPHRQEFPVPLSYLPKANRSHQVLLAPPAGHRLQKCDPGGVCSDDGVAEGWTDLHLNISGLVQPGPRYNGWGPGWLLAAPLRRAGILPTRAPDVSWLYNYGAEVYISYAYNSRGFCGTIDYPNRPCLDSGSFLDSRPPMMVDIRNTFFDEVGNIVFDSSHTLFPEAFGSRMRDWFDNVKQVGFAALVPWLTPSDARWVDTSSRVYDAMLARDLAKPPPIFASRYVRVQVFPRLPVKSLTFVFQIRVSALSRLIQAHPGIFSVGGALTIATIVGGCFGFGAMVVCTVVMIHYIKQLASHESS